MAETQSWSDWTCTCLCKNYIRLASFLVVALGAITLIVVLAFFFYMRKGPLSLFQELGEASAVKWLALCVAVFLIIAGAVGMKFAASRVKWHGGCFVVILLLAVIFQLAVVLTFMTKPGQSNAKASSFASLADRYGETDINGKPPWRCTNLSAVEPLTLGTAEKGWCSGRMKPECEKATYADAIVDQCSPVLGDDRSAEIFGRWCDRCSNQWWSDIESVMQRKDSLHQTLQQYRDKWGGDEGKVYCRCVGRLMDVVERHETGVMGCTYGFLAFQVALLMSTVWLLACCRQRNAPEAGEV